MSVSSEIMSRSAISMGCIIAYWIQINVPLNKAVDASCTLKLWLVLGLLSSVLYRGKGVEWIIRMCVQEDIHELRGGSICSPG